MINLHFFLHCTCDLKLLQVMMLHKIKLYGICVRKGKAFVFNNHLQKS
jgi:hypothetical protein